MSQSTGALSGNRILLAAEYAHDGGTRAYFKGLLDFFHKQGAYVCVVSSFCAPDAEMSDYAQNYGFDLIPFTSFALQFGLEKSHVAPTVWSLRKHRHEIAAFRRLMSDYNLNQVTISVGTSGLFLSAAAATQNPLMIAHGYPHGRRQTLLGSIYMSRMVPSDLLLISTSNYSNQLFRKAWNSQKRGFSAHNIYNTCGPLQQTFPFNSRTNTVLTVSMVESYKRPFDWIDIAKQTYEASHLTDLEFKWVGEGPQRVDALRETDKFGIHYANFLGWQSSVVSFYETAKVYLQTSSIENLSLSTLDALRYGVPSVVTSAGALPEIVSDGVNGFVVPVGDASAAATAVGELLNDTKLWNRQSVAAREIYQDRFSEEVWERELLEAHLKASI